MSTHPLEKETSIWTWIICSILILAFVGFWVGAIVRAGEKDSTPGRRGGKKFDMETDKLIVWISIATISTLVFAYIIFTIFFPWLNDALVE
jgi:heme/copper-type cytochrome/quinol oxidase subunit 2|mmetsp:Transcript_909/g.1247  ORF Transcript_909/g.1247 Transcript_909/m.1247 type:complete len:91 (-) Transcript_909:382-654(-)